MATNTPHVVVIGAGFAGLRAVRALRNAPVTVTLIDRHNFQTFQPLLYQVATAGLNAADVAFPVRGVTRRFKNCRFRQGVVTSVDPGERAVHLADGTAVAYDYLIVSGGSRAAYFGVPGAEEHAFALYSLADATRLRNQILSRIEMADANPEQIERGLLTFVVVGGGPTGVEMAGGLYDVCVGILRKDFPHLREHRVQVVLIDMLDVVLSAFHPRSQHYALKALRKRSVDVRFGEKVAEIEEHALVLVDGTRIETSTVIWAAGVQTEGLAGMLDAERTRGGRVVVESDLSVTDHPEIFIAGDMASAVEQNGSSYPQVAQVANQSGDHAGRQVLRRIEGQPTEPFVFTSKGNMATIGRHAAIAELPSGLRITGLLGWVSWLLVHLVYLVGFRTRLSVLVNWVWGEVTRERGPRLIFTPPRSRQEAIDTSGAAHG
jgi:NADH dehydrogenase